MIYSYSGSKYHILGHSDKFAPDLSAIMRHLKSIEIIYLIVRTGEYQS